MAAYQRPRYWREAASLILTVPRTTTHPSGRQPERTIRDNNNNNVGSSGVDQKNVLMIQRGGKSAFLSNTFAFPGGVVSDVDFDATKWAPLFIKATGAESMKDIAGAFQSDRVRVPMMQRDSSERHLPPDLGFRICAIRETFEESGVLLVSDLSAVREKYMSSDIRADPPPVVAMPPHFDRASWRQRVIENDQELVTLCRHYGVVPNVWALYEWCNWLTPVFQKSEYPPKKPRRFDTIFFLCGLNDSILADEGIKNDEIASVQWDQPSSWYRRGQSREILLVGPQYYEISRLTVFSDVTDLVRYARTREPLGLQRWMSVSYICDDGVFFVLPGDELYPEDPDYEGTRDLLTLEGSVLSNCQAAKRFHRGIRLVWDYFCNITLPYGLITQRFAKTTFPDKLDELEPKL